MSLRKNSGVRKPIEQTTRKNKQNIASTAFKSQQSSLGTSFVNGRSTELYPKVEEASSQGAKGQDWLDELDLLREALRIRDTEIAYLKKTVSTLKTSQSSSGSAQSYSLESKALAILQLKQEMDRLSSKHLAVCDRVSQLQSKLRQTRSRAQLQQHKLKEQLQMKDSDMRYQREEYERVVDNMKIANQDKLQGRIRVIEDRHRKQQELLKQQINNLKTESSEKTLEIARINDKLRIQKEQNEAAYKYLEHQNKELLKRLEQLEPLLRKQFKLREENLICQFNQDIDNLHRQQKAEIELLCKRIDSLKKMVKEKEESVRQLWKARDTQAGHLFGINATRLQTVPVQQYMKEEPSEEPLFERAQTEAKPESLCVRTCAESLKLPGLQQYMKLAK